MPNPISLETLDRIRSGLRSLVTERARTLRNFRYCDLRVQIREAKWGSAENEMEKTSSEDVSFDFGVRVIVRHKMAAAGYFGQILGPADVERIDSVVWEGIKEAHSRARSNALKKAQTRRFYPGLADSLDDTYLARVPVAEDSIPATYEIDPRTVPLEDTVRMAVAGCSAAKSRSQDIVFTAASASTFLQRELFLSSDGADLDQTFAQTEGFIMAISGSQYGNYELYDFTGHQRGWEVLTRGYRNGPIELPDFAAFCRQLGRDTADVAAAPPLRPPDREVPVVTDPHFNTLLVHEVVGHPSELDRALKYETAYAGRSWFMKSLRDNQLGRQIASPLVTAFSDPRMEGYGSFHYDHEGTPGRRAYIIRDGVLEEFLNNRQTAAILGVSPNGSARATEAHLAPLIRMTNTVFAPGERDPQDIIAEVDSGYYISGHRTPSIAESRENFRITAVKVYEIENGRLGRLYRDGGITADSRNYFQYIDAVGNDLEVNPIPNCGKGQPMQAKRMSNGGPTMRGVARLTGPG